MTLRALASWRLTIGLFLALALVIGFGSYWTGAVRGHEGTHFDPATALLASNRSGLKICVQSLIPDVPASSVQRQVLSGLDDVKKHPDFSRGGLDRQPVVVEVGCPAGPTIADPEFVRGHKPGVAAIVKEASPYRLFVFVASPEQIAQAFAWQPHLTPQERLCEGGVCYEITTALYLTPAEIADPAVFARSLTQGLGLWPEGRPQNNPAFDPFGR